MVTKKTKLVMERQQIPKPMSKKLLLVDQGTSGLAGVYIAEIYENLNCMGNVEVITGYYFKEPYGKKWFYRFSDLAKQTAYPLGKLRLYVRGFELIYAMARMLLNLSQGDIKVICYALSSNLKLELCFLWMCKHILHLKICIICHDVIPFLSEKERLEMKSRSRARFYSLADTLVVHNANSINDLTSFFGVSPNKVREFPFPVSNLQRLKQSWDCLNSPVVAQRNFLFIGHLRREKGVEVLLDAWKICLREQIGWTLTIAGNLPPGGAKLSNEDKLPGVCYVLDFQSDANYLRRIRESSCVVLPYIRGTNSGIPPVVLALERDLIVSDIEMFRNNSLIASDCFFKAGDSAELSKKMLEYAKMSDPSRTARTLLRPEQIEKYRKDFRIRINEVFDELLSSS